MLCNELPLSSSSSLKAIQPVLDDELPVLLLLLLLFNIVALIAVLELMKEGRRFFFKNFYCSSGKAPVWLIVLTFFFQTPLET